MRTLGERIKARRRELRLTQRQVAERAGLSKSFLSHIEMDKGGISAANLLSLGRVFGCTPDYLMLGADNNSSDDPCRAALVRFFEAWEDCEGGRGCYSCSPRHDSRCRNARGIGECTCGRDALEQAADAVLRFIAESDPEEI